MIIISSPLSSKKDECFSEALEYGVVEAVGRNN
jgi:hypothetical protein